MLHDLNIRSVMVEGGARVIGSFFAETTPLETGEGIIDTLIMTVAPTLVGADGVGYGVKIGEVRHHQLI
jgi:2,5-diamino-6-(ribosylamino)-4(3H)-pyrimidinone 5'-phosphate reductase